MREDELGAQQSPSLNTIKNNKNFSLSQDLSSFSPLVKTGGKEDMETAKARNNITNNNNNDNISKNENKLVRVNSDTGNKDQWAQILKRGEEIYRQASDAQRRDFSLDEIKHVEFLASSILHEVRGMIAADPKGSTSSISPSPLSSSTPSVSASTSASSASAPAVEIPANTEITEDGVLKKRRGRPPIRKPLCCQQCGTTETPEWRRGEGGPNTLCNGCGLRWAKRMKMREGDGNQNADGKKGSATKAARGSKSKGKNAKPNQSPEGMLRPKTEPDETQASYAHYMRNFAHSQDDVPPPESEGMLSVNEHGMWGPPLSPSPATTPRSPSHSSNLYNSTPPLSPSNPHPSPNNSHMGMHVVTDMNNFKENALKVQIPNNPYSNMHPSAYAMLQHSGNFQYSPYPVHISPLPQTPSHHNFVPSEMGYPTQNKNNGFPQQAQRVPNNNYINYLNNSNGQFSPIPLSIHTPSPSAPPSHSSLQSAFMGNNMEHSQLHNSAELNLSYPQGRQSQKQSSNQQPQQQPVQQKNSPRSPKQSHPSSSPPQTPPKQTQKQQLQKNLQNLQKQKLLKQQQVLHNPEHQNEQQENHEETHEQPLHQQQVLQMLQNPHLFPYQSMDGVLQNHQNNNNHNGNSIHDQQYQFHHPLSSYSNQIPAYLHEFMLQQQIQQQQQQHSMYQQLQLQQPQLQQQQQQQQQREQP